MCEYAYIESVCVYIHAEIQIVITLLLVKMTRVHAGGKRQTYRQPAKVLQTSMGLSFSIITVESHRSSK